MSRPEGSRDTGQGASGQHEFVEPYDVRGGLTLRTTQPDFQQAASFAVAEASLRAVRCGRAGCGRPREDQIHWPAEPDNQGSIRS